MTDFKAKMHQIRFRLGLRPRLRWGSLQRSPRSPSWIWGPYFSGEGKGEEGKGEEGRGEEGKGRAMSPHHLDEVYAYAYFFIIKETTTIFKSYINVHITTSVGGI